MLELSAVDLDEMATAVSARNRPAPATADDEPYRPRPRRTSCRRRPRPQPLLAPPEVSVKDYGRVMSAGEILRPFGGTRSVQQAGGLADLDEVAVRIPHVAADLCLAVDRRRDELGPLRLPFFVAGPDVSDAQVQEDRRGVAGLVVDHGDLQLVGGGRPAGEPVWTPR